jgi:murein DD-endopeptidase MepM/ murein hydrolase activator NlpD
MDKKYSILILSWRGTGMRRLVFSQKLLRCCLPAGIVLTAITGWLLGDYLWLKLQTQEAELLRLKIATQQKRLSTLQEMTKNLQELAGNWRGVSQKVRASLSPGARRAYDGHQGVDELEDTLVSLETKLNDLITSVPTEWPASGQVTSGVGTRLSPFTGEPEFHAGIDIPNPTGTPVHAPGNGVVDFAGESAGNGRNVVLSHGQGITTLYAHLSKAYVKKGDRVRKGEKIAEVGSTGKSTSPHLHYEVRVNGVPIEPRDHLLK